MLPLVLMLLPFAVASSAVFGQAKVITSNDYRTAKNAAEKVTWNTYPRIEIYTYKNDEPKDVWLRMVFESKDRNYREIIIRDRDGRKHEEEVEYDGEILLRDVGGIWRIPESDGVELGSGRGRATDVYTIETVTTDGKTFTLYTETSAFPDGKTYVCWFKVDDKGRIAAYEDKEDGHRQMTREFPDKIFPIKKPRLGSRDNVWYRSESPTRGSSPVPPVNTKPK